MSQQQKYSEYLYFTIHQDSEQDAESFLEKYQFDKAYCCLSYWNKGQINDEKTHQFNVMCIKLEIGEVEYMHDFTQHIIVWLHQFKHQTQIIACPQEFTRTLHLVTHGENLQNAGFHLDHQLLRALAELSIGFNLHGFLDADDEQDYPFSIPLSFEIQPKKISEYAYFWLESDHHHAKELQNLLPALDFSVDFDQGIHQEKQRKMSSSSRSSISLKSTLDPSLFQLEDHLQEIIQQLKPYQVQLQTLFFDEKIAFGINATGHLENPHHRQIRASTMQQLFALGLNLDVDYYFA